MSDGGLWVSDESNGRLIRLGADGSTQQVIDDPRGPEGVVPLDDGRLIVAEQRADRVVVIRPPSATPEAVLAQLQPVSGQDGVDSISLDAAQGRVLIPDSARGALRAVPAGGGELTTLATGLGRPVDAATDVDGTILVAAEGRPGLWRVGGGGGAPTGVGQNELDEVLPIGGLLYTTGIVDGTVRAVDPSSGASRVLVSGVGAAQGLAQLADGRLAVSDSNRGTIATFAAC